MRASYTPMVMECSGYLGWSRYDSLDISDELSWTILPFLLRVALAML